MLLLEKILHSKKLSYDTLMPLVKPYINNKTIITGTDREYNTVNIFIDFWDIVKSLYNPQTLETMNSLKQRERFMIASEVINIIGHYRHFFYSRLKMYTNFVFYYSDKRDTRLTNIDKNYRSSFYEKRLDDKNQTFGLFNNMVKKNVHIIKLFCEYVPHAYFIKTDEMDPRLVPHLFLSENSRLKQNIINKNDMNIIISNEKIHYQDLNLQDRILQLELRGKEKSRFVASEDIIDILLEKSKKDYYFSILPDMYSLLVSLTGYKDYDISSIKKMGNIKALNFIQKCIDNNILKNIEYNNTDLLNGLRDELGEENLKELYKNMQLLNNNLYNFSNKDIINIESQLFDRIDAESVKFVNSKYFDRYPILLEYVFEGEKYE
ncbi:hypothetical protein AR9_g220 [Bacillus phage AR9]|uniref:Uncharacterized protein n=2 Tax=Bacillus phage PBS1 TaxID=10683 RepID=A0A172JIC0_BPPB1|nr:hypothetical protein BI022_gp219 [Bacillus phage AR9]YP_009664313.1 hypothetical protein FK780_gp111 [Bacillus phage PBS1]QXN70142.1 hypothetical protein INTERNEXUS_101 [Bacillus phage vB_BspM_Internexus]AMS01304.1 hypothetical protein AR9_g220 [Bacillus phage AR9]AST99933.1 hypothetical protein PBI_PBS1_111 [Bacillus phage PBS1]BDE75248.1 hypothetical protein [Bacillus phage PBS1]